MGKDWDKAVPSVEVWRECLRVLKHGAFAFVMSSPRQDVLSQMIVRLGEAGFNMGFSSIYWAYASGFPKAMNVSKAVDKHGGANLSEFSRLLKKRRIDLGLSQKDVAKHFLSVTGGLTGCIWNWEDGKNSPTLEEYNKLRVVLKLDDFPEIQEAEREIIGKFPMTIGIGGNSERMGKEKVIDIPETEQARLLDGAFGGFQPKPAVEVILVCMKPLSEKTFVDQALKNGKGVTWLDKCRISLGNNESIEDFERSTGGYNAKSEIYHNSEKYQLKDFNSTLKGRFPANLLISDDALNDGTITKSRASNYNFAESKNDNSVHITRNIKSGIHFSDAGSFSRYFDLDRWMSETLKKLPKEVRATFPFLITPKASKGERNEGLEKLDNATYLDESRHDKTAIGCNNPRNRTGKIRNGNVHPTVKPLALMSYLITLGSLPKDLVLDPFVGSGTTCLAAKMLGRRYIGIDNNPEYIQIANARLNSFQTLDAFPINEKKQECPILAH